MFLFYKRADQNTSRSLCDKCFGWRESKIKICTHTEKTKTAEESPVIITSLYLLQVVAW